MKITVLGSGDTLGLPLAGISSPDKRFRFGLLLEIGETKILIDTNPDLKWQCINSSFQLKDIDAILITHTHSDHINGMGEFFYRRYLPIPTYHLNNPLTRRHIDYFRYLENEKVLKFISYQNYQPFRLFESILVTPVELNHGFPCSGFIIEAENKKIGIISDTNFKLNVKTISALKKCDLVFVDAFAENMEQVAEVYKECNIEVPNLSEEWFHMTLPEAKELQRVTNSKLLCTVHMSHHLISHIQLVKKYQSNNFLIGYDNLTIIV